MVQFHKISGIKVGVLEAHNAERGRETERILDEDADAVGGLSTREELFLVARDCTVNLTGEDSVTSEFGSFHRLQNSHR